MPDFEDDTEGDSEEMKAALVSIPEITVDPDQHFVKKPRYASEIRNIIACQGEFCPGTRSSPHVVQFPGKSSHDEPVFEKLVPRYILYQVHPLASYKAWILQLIDGLRFLHSLDIVRRDLRIDNFLFSDDGSRLVICDLESHWGKPAGP